MTGKYSRHEKILFPVLVVFVFLAGLSKIGDYDIFFHLRTGSEMLSSGRLSHAIDPFALSTSSPMSNTAWLSDIIFYIVHSASGVWGLVVFKALVIAAVFYVLLGIMRLLSRQQGRGGNAFVFFAMLVVTVFAIRMRMFVRPFIFEYLFLALSLYLLQTWRVKAESGVEKRRKARRNFLILLPVIQVFWTNMHPSCIVGIALAGIFLTAEAGRFVFQRSQFSRKRLLTFLTATVLVVIATLISPRGIEAIIFPFTHTGKGLYMANIAEWQPLTFAHLTGYNLRYTWGFCVLALACVVSFLYRLLHRNEKVELTEVLLFLVFLVMAIKRIRFTAEFSIVLAPVAATGISKIVNSISRKVKDGGGRQSQEQESEARGAGQHRPALTCLSVVCVLLLALVFYVSIFKSTTYAFGAGLKKRVFPVTAVNFLIENGIKGNMYNSLGYGGYLMWRMYPEHKVFIDGRNEVYSQDFYSDYLEAHTDSHIFQKVVRKYNIDWVILEYSRDYSRKERMPHLASNPNWALVYFDRVAMVYARRGPVNRELINNYEYKYIRPNDLNPSYLTPALTTVDGVQGAIAEFKSNLRINPDNEESHIGLAYLYYRARMHGKERKEWEAVVRINPNLVFARVALGELLLQEGDKEGGRREFRAALKIKPGDKAALRGLSRLNRSTGN